MAQVTFYLTADTEARARNAANAQGTNIRRSIAGQVAEKVDHTWPPDVLSAIRSSPIFRSWLSCAATTVRTRTERPWIDAAR